MDAYMKVDRKAWSFCRLPVTPSLLPSFLEPRPAIQPHPTSRGTIFFIGWGRKGSEGVLGEIEYNARQKKAENCGSRHRGSFDAIATIAKVPPELSHHHQRAFVLFSILKFFFFTREVVRHVALGCMKKICQWSKVWMCISAGCPPDGLKWTTPLPIRRTEGAIRKLFLKK